MKKLIINTIILIIFLGPPLVVNLMSFHLVILENKLAVKLNDSFSKDVEVLTGDIAYLSAIMSLANDSKSKNDGVPISREISNSISQMIFIPPKKIKFFILLIIKNKTLYFTKNDLTAVYVKIPLPPPKVL